MASFFIVFRPLNEQLKDQIYKNYRIISTQKDTRVEQYIERSMEGASSLSSRTMIRNAIQDYHDGLISFTELSDYTQSKYEDGVNALYNVSSATRIVDGMIVAQVSHPNQNDSFESLNDITEITFRVVEFDDEIYVDVVSPITYNQIIIGYDILTFNMMSLIAELNEGDGQLIILDTQAYSTLVHNTKTIISHQECTILLKDGKVVYVSDGLLSYDDSYVSVAISQDLLEEEIRRVTTRSLVWTIFLIIFSLLIVVFVSAKNASKKLKVTEDKRKFFQDKANKDALTGAYTRHYFKYWLEKKQKNNNASIQPTAIVMSDVNGFKHYNDTFGHQQGDDALVRITEIINHSIRDNDLLIRYGGDEFLLVFTRCDETLCETIMDRINKLIIQDEELSELSLAYGYTIITDFEEMDTAIEIADKRMYEQKSKLDK